MTAVGLAIFVKTPSLSPVKTRLWPHIGRRCAEAFHLASAEAVASVVQRAQQHGSLQSHWAVAEAAALHGDIWPDLPRMFQGDGGLGERMRHVHAELLRNHGAALLLGADAPQLSAASLLRAAEWLQSAQARLILGRAEDGGFWLFGSNRSVPETAWTSVEYSTPNTARDFLERVSALGACQELEVLNDVDHFHDFQPACDQLHALDSPTDAQQRLRTWMKEVLAREGVCP
jgi:uncharacterized protein